MKTIDISGFGGGYEATCQKALMNGVRFLKAHPDADWGKAYKGFEGVYGLISPESQIAKDLDKYLGKDIPDCLGMTGAIHQAVVSQLLRIAGYGSYDKWIEEAEKAIPDRIYEVDEDKIDTLLAVEATDFQLELDAGYDFLAELKKVVPEEEWIRFDPDNPAKAFQELKRRLEGESK